MPLNPDLRAKLQYATEHYEALVAAEQHRATYLLATMIVDPLEPETSIAELEKIGEEKVRMTITQLQHAKDNEKNSLDPYPQRVSVGFMGILDNVRESIADLEDGTDKELITYASKRWGGRTTNAQFQRAIKLCSLVP